MKTKEIIISVASVVLTAVIVSAGVVIKNQVDRYRAYSNEAKKIICKYDPTFKNEPLDKIIIGMATVPNEDINPMFPTVIAIPPTLNEVQAYLSACALFENVNPAYGRNLSAFVPIYASGEISDSYIFASDRIDINSGDQYLGVVEFTFWGKNFSWDNVKKLMAKKSKFDILKYYKGVESRLQNEGIFNSGIYLYELLTKENGVTLGRDRLIKHSITWPISIYEIYGNDKRGNIYTEAYNPIERVRLSNEK